MATLPEDQVETVFVTTAAEFWAEIDARKGRLQEGADWQRPENPHDAALGYIVTIAHVGGFYHTRLVAPDEATADAIAASIF